VLRQGVAVDAKWIELRESAIAMVDEAVSACLSAQALHFLLNAIVVSNPRLVVDLADRLGTWWG